MRGRGLDPHTELMLNAGNGLDPLNMKQQEPIFLFYPEPISGEILAFHSTRVRGVPAWVGY